MSMIRLGATWRMYGLLNPESPGSTAPEKESAEEDRPDKSNEGKTMQPGG